MDLTSVAGAFAEKATGIMELGKGRNSGPATTGEQITSLGRSSFRGGEAGFAA
jgi:hypothetical protein